MTVAVLVPRRNDGGRRDDLWAYVKTRWTRLHPDFEIIEGHHDDGPFNRAAAINTARAATTADTLIIADSDTFVSPTQVDQAITAATRHRQVTFAYDRYCYLSRSMSDRIMAGYDGDWWPGVEFTMQGTCSQVVVVPADLFDEAGGADEGFIGWGGEDVALSLALQTFGGGLQRITGDVWHLWHPPAPHTHDDHWPARVKLYGDAAYDRAKMRALIARLAEERTAA